jgi:ABC-2 type transport system permease protein
MKQIWIITSREMKSFFDSLMAYILIVLFLIFNGLLTWISPGNILESGQADLRQFFGIAFWTLFIFIPAVTMKMVAEEKKSGTIELLLTKPVSDWQFLSGKFWASLLLIAVTLGLTLVYYISVASIGPVDHGEVWTGYLGLLLMSSAYISIGIMCSTITNNQIEAFLMSLFIGIFFHWIFGAVASQMSGVVAEVLNYMSITTHFGSITRGVIDSKDVIFFLSIVFTGLFISEAVLAKRNYGK